MSIQKYNNYIEINPSFESVVDLAADTRNKKLWKEYIVGNDMVNLMDSLCQTLGNEKPDSRRSLWIHGSYGTGKSYAGIVLKHLLEDSCETVDEYLKNNQRLSEFRNRFMKCKKKGDFLVIWKSGCTGIRTGDQLLVAAEFEIRNALKRKFGDSANYGTASLQTSVKEQLKNKNRNLQTGGEIRDIYSI